MKLPERVTRSVIGTRCRTTHPLCLQRRDTGADHGGFKKFYRIGDPR